MPVIKQQRQIFNKRIGVQSFDTGAQQVGLAASKFANTVGQIAYETGAKVAEERGTEAAQSIPSDELLTFNPETGKPQAMQSTDGMGSIARDAFKQVLDRRFVDTLDKDVRIKSQEIASKYKNPNQYEKVFGEYLNSLSQGADERFSNIVSESGKYVMASTKLSLADAARARARSAAASAVSDTNNEQSETIFDIAATGKVSTAVAVLEGRVQASSEAVNAGLYKKGYAESVRGDLAKSAFDGALQYVQNGATPLQQAGINQYIGSQGRIGKELLSPNQLEILEPLIGYVDLSNTKSILESSSQIASRYNAVSRIQSEQAKAQADFEQRAFVIGIENNAVNRASSAAQSMSNAWSTGNQASIQGVIDSFDSTYSGQVNQFQQQFLANTITETEMKQQNEVQRRAVLTPMVIAAANDGNIESLKSAFTTGSVADLAMLTDLQQQTVRSLQNSALYSFAEDREYVSSLLSGSKNEVREKIESQQRVADITSRVGDVTKSFIEGTFDENTSKEITDSINKSLNDGDISASQFESFQSSLNSAAARGIINIASGGMNSSELLALTSYIKSGGNETLSASPAVQGVGNQILSLTPEGKLSEVTNHANTLREKMSAKEAKIEAGIKARANAARVTTGGGSVGSKSDRVTMQEEMNKRGVNIFTPESKTGENYAMWRTTPPQGMIDGFEALVAGASVQGADVLIDHYAVLSQELTASGTYVNRFGLDKSGGSLSEETSAFLTQVHKIRDAIGGNAGEIAQTLANLRSEPKSNIILKEALGNKTAASVLSSKYDPQTAQDFAPALEFYLRTGSSMKQAMENIETQVDSVYLKSVNVVNPFAPIGQQGKTVHSLEAKIPNEERRDAFVSAVNSQLPDGYRLFTEGDMQTLRRTGIASEMSAIRDAKQVFLVDNPSTASMSYDAFVLNDYNELEPLIIERDGQMFIPRFDADDLSEYDKNQARIIESDRERLLDETEEFIKDMRGFTPG